MSSPRKLIALLHGPDRPGLVARVAGWIFERGGNILHADQHNDPEAGVFFQRVEWEPRSAAPADTLPSEAAARSGGPAQEGLPRLTPLPTEAAARSSGPAQEGVPRSTPFTTEATAFTSFAATLGMSARVTSTGDRAKVAIFVSKADHCFHDLALRWKAGEFACDIVGVVSNHPDMADAARGYGLPYHVVPVTAQNKAQAEARTLALMRELGVELVVLARFMQVLSAGFLADFGRPVINIHHSFLPAFAGGKPYHQAHERGVKLIGATAHYATAELDDGPIIQQDVTRVTHRHSVADLIRKGRDLEKTVLAQAVRWHLESRVLAYGRKTVVFD